MFNCSQKQTNNIKRQAFKSAFQMKGRKFEVEIDDKLRQFKLYYDVHVFFCISGKQSSNNIIIIIAKGKMEPKCQKGRPPYTVCASSSCKSSPFMCSEDCECFDAHDNCDNIKRWKKFHSKVIYKFMNQKGKLKDYTQKYLNLVGADFFNIQKEIDRIPSIEFDEKTLQSFFLPKKIVKMDLLYRASENQFNVMKFHQKCDDKGPTVVFVKTEFNKVIGGYTPISWTSEDRFKCDPKKESFIFSLSNKEKLKIVNFQDKEIGCSSSYGPIFGGGSDIQINDKANRNQGSYCAVGYTYNNGQYTLGTQESFKKFSGQEKGFTFRVLEWEVFSIKLQ